MEDFNTAEALDPDCPEVFLNRGILYAHLRQYDRAELWRRKWLVVVKEKAGPDSVAYAAELLDLGENLLRQQKCADAEPVLRECLAILQRTQPDAWATSFTRTSLGAALAGCRKYAEAEPLLLQGYEGLKQTEFVHPLVRRWRKHAGEWLIRLYEETEQPEKARQWNEKLATKAPSN